MTHPDPLLPEIADSRGSVLAAAVLLFALASIAAAVEVAAGPETADYARWLKLAAALPATLLIGGVSVWKVRRVPREQRRFLFAMDGHSREALRTACQRSCIATLVVVLLLERVATRLPDLPAAFYLRVALAVLLGVAGGVYLRLDVAARACLEE